MSATEIMSVLNYPPSNDDEILRHCTKKCGIITATEDQSYFALGCIFCPIKFLYFDAFIGHIQTDHADIAQKGLFDSVIGESCSSGEAGETNNLDADRVAENTNAGAAGEFNEEEGEDLTDTDPSLLEPQMIMVKEEILDEEPQHDEDLITGDLPVLNELEEMSEAFFNVKQEQYDPDVSLEMDEQSYNTESYGNYDDYTDDVGEDEEQHFKSEIGDANYDDLVEQSLISETGLAMHIKDRKMIQFLIDSYRRNSFLWDHRHPQFRDRVRRQQFLDWILMEYKRRFNIALARDAITRKWDNLRTVYKRECNRMSLENTNVSTLWYFKELHFLNRLYGGNQKISDAVVKETVYRRRYSALWNDISTGKLLAMVKQYPCFYDKYNIDYRSKEKRGEALQIMVKQLHDMVDVTTIQISKRISQLRFDYSKQKQERLLCEQTNKVFVPSYTYYEQMKFMDADVAPFKCEYCTQILQATRDLDLHLLTHQTNSTHVYTCTICHMTFTDHEQFNRHKQIHGFASSTTSTAATPTKDTRHYCDLCTASFREKSNYDEHMRRHNDELFLPSLANHFDASATDDVAVDRPHVCEICCKSFSNIGYLNAHRAIHSNNQNFTCEYPQCGKQFTAHQSMMEHTKQHYSDEDYRCDVCGKSFRSSKNLHNHRQIHDTVKKYICKICGSAFAQAAGLYLHKRRHNRQHPGSRLNYL